MAVCLTLHDWADFAVIGTAAVGMYAYWKYQYDLRQKVKRLEEYLRTVKVEDQREGKKGQHSIYHLISKVELTQDEVIQASFRSKHIACKARTGAEDSDLATDLLFEYVDKK